MDINKARALFFEEAYEQCDNLEHALLDRETYPANPDTYNLMFRTAHTIKGSASMLGLTMLVRFAHAMENMLTRLRSGEIRLDEHLINLLLACNDQLRDLLQGAEHNPELPQTETQQILALLSQLQGHQSLPNPPISLPVQACCGRARYAHVAPVAALLSGPLSGWFRSAGVYSLSRQSGGYRLYRAGLA